MTRSDVWRKPPRPRVARWLEFKDRVRELAVKVGDDDAYLFEIAMPASWSKKKRDAMRGQLHRQTPDLDNLIGGLWDAAAPDGDQHIATTLGAAKKWADVGAIHVQRRRVSYL